jgi:hypothetical protein
MTTMDSNLVSAPLDAETFRAMVRADLARGLLAYVCETLDELAGGTKSSARTARSSGVRTKALKAPVINTVPRNARVLYQEVLQVAVEGVRILDAKPKNET